MMKKILVIFSILLLIFNAIACTDKSSPSEVAKNFYSYLYKGEVQKAEDFLSSDAKEVLKTFGLSISSVSSELAKKAEKRGGLREVQVVEEKIVAETASVSTKMLYGDGSSEQEDDNLVKEGGKWKMSVSK